MGEGPFKKEVLYHFEAFGDWYGISPLSPPDEDGKRYAEVEELRKNGQEDTHMSGIVCYDPADSSWTVIEGVSQFDTYGEGVEPIESYLRGHGHPDLVTDDIEKEVQACLRECNAIARRLPTDEARHRLGSLFDGLG